MFEIITWNGSGPYSFGSGKTHKNTKGCLEKKRQPLVF